ncbi:Cation/H+ exchanger [Aspergillus egyptiacus]|nr:Cation/H+ exchanger [Aspergillus egyptiacus]
MPDIHTDPFNVICGILGTYFFCYSFVSYLLKDRLYLSEPLLSLLVGLLVSPSAAKLAHPDAYVSIDPQANPLSTAHRLERATLDFSRLVLCIQVCLTGAQLPRRYARFHWRDLFLLLGPAMAGMWMMSALLVWSIVRVPGKDTDSETATTMPFLHALAVAACITPTDPVLSNTIVKGRWADRYVPVPMSHLIGAESGANDGLGYPFVYLALYLLKYLGTQGYQGVPGDGGAAGSWGGARSAMGMWFGRTWGYLVLLGAVWGGVVGWVTRRCLKVAVALGYTSQENLYTVTVVIAVFLVGTCGLVGSDDILACFVAGNALSWDGWFQKETRHDSFEPAIDMLLTMAFFVWFGAVCPWPLFISSFVPLWRLVVVAITILLLRRLPVLLLLYKQLRPVHHPRQALFMGFFGPIGVSAIFYQHEAMEFLRTEVKGPDGEIRQDAQTLSDLVRVVVWFVVLSSAVIHGLSIPIYQCARYLIQHIKPGETEHSLRDMIRSEKEYILSRPWVSKLEADLEAAEAPLRNLARPKPPFRRLRVEREEEPRPELSR